MRIEAVELHHVEIPLRQAFAHAASARTTSEAVLVSVRDDEGVEGWGEIRPRDYVTGETIDGVLSEHGPALARRLTAATWPDREAVLAWLQAELSRPDVPLATFGGLEAAVLDAAGRRLGFSLADALGGGEPGPPLPPGVVIGFEVATEKLARHCAMLRYAGREHLKIKVGRDDDERRLEIVTEVFGRELPLRLDANATWSVDEAVARVRALSRFCLHSIEQPVDKADLAGLRRVREATGVPVMADESLCSEADAHALVGARAADVFNVRIGKHGGVLAARRIAAIGRDAGVALHLGTLVGETGILSRQAEVLGRMVPGFACLDGKGQHRFLLVADVLQVPEKSAKAPSLDAALDAPGLGVRVDLQTVARFRVQTSPPRRG